MSGVGLAEVVVRARCSPNFFDFFGVPPLLGRAFTARNQAPQCRARPDSRHQLQVLAKRVFQGRPDVLGQTIRLNNDVYTIAGVLPGPLHLDGSWTSTCPWT